MNHREVSASGKTYWVWRYDLVMISLMLAGLFAFAGATHAATVTQTPTFSAAGDAWAGGGVTRRSFSKDFSIPLAGSVDFGPGVTCPLGVCVGAKAIVSTTGSIGVSLRANFKNPAYSLTNPYNVSFSLPETTTLAGNGFSLGMTANASSTRLTTSFLAPSVGTDFFMKNVGAKISGKACIGACVSGTQKLLGPFNNTTTLVGFNNPGGGSTPSLTVLGSSYSLSFPYDIKVANTVTVTIDNANISAANTGNGSVTVNSLQDVVTVKPDVSKMLAKATGVPLNLDVSFLGLSLSYKTLWGEIAPAVGVDMDSSFTSGALNTGLRLDKPIGKWNTAHTGYTLVKSISLNSGDSLSDYFFLHPGETVNVTPTYSVANGSFMNTTSATLHAPYSVEILSGSLSKVGSFGPVYSTHGDLHLASIPIASSSFAIPFASKAGSKFKLISSPGTCHTAGSISSGFIFDPLCSGTLTKTGSGTVELFADNSYTGGTNLQGGILKIEKDANLGQANGTITFDGGTLLTRNFNSSTTGITSARAVVLQGGGGTFDTNKLNSTLSGVISGAGSLTKKSLGTLTLTGVSTYSGTTNIMGGTLALSGAGSLSNQTAVNVGSGTTFNIRAANGNRAVGSLGGRGSLLLGNRSMTTGGNGLDTVFSGVISGVGGLTKVGKGTQTLSGVNTYSGTTRLNGGTVSVSADANLGIAGALIFDGGALQSTASFTSRRSTTLNAGGGEIDTAGAGVTLTMNTDIGGTGMLAKTGAGRLTLLGRNTYSGGTTINNGTLALSGPGALNTMGAMIINSGVFDIAGTASDATIGSLAGVGNVELGAKSLSMGGNGVDTSFGGVISGIGAVTKTGAGTLILSGNNTYTGDTRVIGGVMQKGASSGDVLSANTGLVIDGGRFDVNGTWEEVGDITLVSGTLDDSVGAGGLSSSGGNYNLQTGNVNVVLGDGANPGAGTIRKTTPGVVNLNAETLASTIDLADGSLQLGKDEIVFAAASVTVGSPGLFDLNGHTETVGSLAGSGGVDLGTGMLTTGGNDADTIFSGVVSGTGGLTKAGAGIMVLSGANTYTGVTTVDGGVLQSGAAEVLYDGGQLRVGGGAFRLNDYTETVGSLAGSGSVDLGTGTLTVGGNGIDTTFSGVIGGTGILTKTGSGSMNLSGVNTFTGMTTIDNGILKVNGILAGELHNRLNGTLMGSGSLLGRVVNDGILAPGNSIGTITVGSYLSNAGSIYEVEVDGAGNSDLIAASGTATLRGGVVDVLAAGVADDYARRTYYDIIKANGGVTGSFDAFTSNISELVPMPLYDNPNRVQLILMRNDVSFGAIAGAQTDNQKSVARVLTEASHRAFSGDLADVLDLFVDGLTEDGRQAALDELGGQEIYTAVPTVAFSLMESFQGAVNGRMSQLHLANGGAITSNATLQGIHLATAGDMSDLKSLDRQGREGFHSWLQAYSLDGDVNSDANAAGYDYGISGAASGIDFLVAKNIHLGFTVGLGTADVDTDHGDNASIESTQAGIYGNYENGQFYLDGMLTYANNNYETSRTINFGSLTRAARGDYRGAEWAFSVEAGCVAREGAYTLQPFLGASFIRVSEDSVTEEGAADLNLKIADRTAYSLKIYPGFKLSRTIKIGEQSLLVPEVSAKLVCETQDSRPTVDASLVGAPVAGSFRVKGIDITRSSIKLSAGFKVLNRDNFHMALNFNTEINSDRSESIAEVSMKYAW